MEGLLLKNNISPEQSDMNPTALVCCGPDITFSTVIYVDVEKKQSE